MEYKVVCVDDQWQLETEVNGLLQQDFKLRGDLEMSFYVDVSDSNYPVEKFKFVQVMVKLDEGESDAVAWFLADDVPAALLQLLENAAWPLKVRLDLADWRVVTGSGLVEDEVEDE